MERSYRPHPSSGRSCDIKVTSEREHGDASMERRLVTTLYHILVIHKKSCLVQCYRASMHVHVHAGNLLLFSSFCTQLSVVRVSGANPASRLSRKVDGNRYNGPHPLGVGQPVDVAGEPAVTLSTIKEVQVRRDGVERERERERERESVYTELIYVLSILNAQ